MILGISLAAPALWASLVGQTPVLSVDDAIKIATQNAFGVRTAASNLEKTKQKASEVKGSLGPRLDVDTTYTRFDKAVSQTQGSSTFVVQPIDSTQSQFRISMPLDLVGVLKRTVNASNVAIRASQELLEAEKSNLKLNVRAAYFDVLQAKAQVKVNEDAVSSAEKQLKNVELEFQAGSKAKVDVLRFQTQLSQAQADLIASNNGLALARNAFNNALSRPIETPFELADAPAMSVLSSPAGALVSAAVSNRPELRSLRSQAEVFKNIRQAEERGLLPSLNVAAVHSRNWNPSGGAQGSSTFGQLLLAIPAWDSGVTRARVNQARQDEEQVRIQTEQLTLAISLEVRQAMTNLANAKARWDVATKQVAFTEEGFRLANIRYAAGEGIPLEVTDAQTELTRARTNLVQATYDYLTSYSQLQRAVGSDDLAGIRAPEIQEVKK